MFKSRRLPCKPPSAVPSCSISVPSQVFVPHLAPMVLLRALPPDSVLPRKTVASPNACSAAPSADLVDSPRPAPSSGAPPAQPPARFTRRPLLGGSLPPATSSLSWRRTGVLGEWEREREASDDSEPDVEPREAFSTPRCLRLRSPPLPTRARKGALAAGCRRVAACDSFGGPPGRGGDLDSDRSSARIQLNGWGQDIGGGKVPRGSVLECQVVALQLASTAANLPDEHPCKQSPKYGRLPHACFTS